MTWALYFPNKAECAQAAKGAAQPGAFSVCRQAVPSRSRWSRDVPRRPAQGALRPASGMFHRHSLRDLRAAVTNKGAGTAPVVLRRPALRPSLNLAGSAQLLGAAVGSSFATGGKYNGRQRGRRSQRRQQRLGGRGGGLSWAGWRRTRAASIAESAGTRDGRRGSGVGDRVGRQADEPAS